MRRIFTTNDARARGLTRAALRWGEKAGKWRKLVPGAFGMGAEVPRSLDVVRATVIVSKGVAYSTLAAVLLDLDGVKFQGLQMIVGPNGNARRGGTSRRVVNEKHVIVVHGVRCTDGVTTLRDLAAVVDDLVWEQALESAHRQKHVSHDDIESLRAYGARSRTEAALRIRRVLARRPPGTPATGSLLETLMLQLARHVLGLGEPVRQYPIEDAFGIIVAYADLAWPAIGLFIELDGEQHKGQRVYDATRETLIVSLTGWLPGRFTWTEVTRFPKHTVRRLTALAAQGRGRATA